MRYVCTQLNTQTYTQFVNLVPKGDSKSFGIKINVFSYLGSSTVLPESLNTSLVSYRIARNLYIRKAHLIADVCEVAHLHLVASTM